NPTIKFKTLIDFADKLGIDKVATGHYSIVKKNKKNNRYFLSKPADDWKNQTYFLWDLPQEYLKRLILPLSNLKKDKVKKIAVKNNFVQLAEKKESYDVCFLAGTNYRDFVDEKVKQMKIDIPKGDFITEDGTVVGKHNGIAHYTIGQRKGLGFAMGIPYYVKNIDKEKNQIIVAPKENLSKNQLTIKDINSVKYLQIPENKKFLTKIRYRDKGKMATVEFKENTAFVTFEEPVFGITPGQSAVFYENNDLVGGGIIV
ncbi:MAG: tRNA methyl transferase PRC-barrel domain-containing protein, partial [Bacteroidota bacterium]|nr:tRNA methyl transferase PRC-barrel domain-containing protein [Bacteroidota bacterium]